MGSQEAMDFLNMLNEYGLVNERTVRAYVLEALFNPDLTEWSEGYEQVYRSILAEVSSHEPGRQFGTQTEEIPPAEQELDPESVIALRYLIGTISEGMIPPEDFRDVFEGFSPTAYSQVHRVLGRRGREFLGISGWNNNLSSDGREIWEVYKQEQAAREEAEVAAEEAEWEKRRNEPDTFDGKLFKWPPKNPFEEPFPRLDSGT